MESTLAGVASRLFSETRAAWAYWAIMRPESTPGSAAKNGGSPCDRAGSSRRSVRRSEMEPRSAAQMARKSSTYADWGAVEIAVGDNRAVGQHHRVVDRRAKFPLGHVFCVSDGVPDGAPATWGAQRRE